MGMKSEWAADGSRPNIMKKGEYPVILLGVLRVAYSTAGRLSGQDFGLPSPSAIKAASMSRWNRSTGLLLGL
jgi:hypothetical protein